MKKTDLQIILILVLFTTIIAVMAVLGQKTKHSVEDNFSALSLNLTTNKKEMLPFEPLIVNLKLENTTSKSIKGHSKLDFSRKFIEFVVTDQEGRSVRVLGKSPTNCKCTIPEQISILPGQKFEEEEVFYNFHEAFSRSGNYKIQAILKNLDRKVEIKSNKIVIKITEPIGLEKQAVKSVENKFRGNTFFFAGLGKTDTYDKLEILFPGTVYSDYASYFIGLNYLEQKQFAEAKMHFSRISKREGFVFADDLLKQENKLKNH